MGYRVAGQRLEQDIGLAAPLHFAAGGDAFGIGEQDDLEQDRRENAPCRRCGTWGETPIGPACARSGSAPHAQTSLAAAAPSS